MIRFQYPEKSVATRVIGVGFLEDTAHDPRCGQELAAHRWNYVVLQAQKISGSGQFEYSRKEGIDLAKQARAAGAAVFFFSEWPRRNVGGESERSEKVYREMAGAADADVLPIGAAWELARSERPELPLHHEDGNHESPLGAFLTACVIVGRLTDQSPVPLASFPYLDYSGADREFLAGVAARTLESRSR